MKTATVKLYGMTGLLDSWDIASEVNFHTSGASFKTTDGIEVNIWQAKGQAIVVEKIADSKQS